MLCTSSTVLYLPRLALPASAWRFDLWSALIGAAVAFLLVGLAYRFREELRLGGEAITDPLVRLRQRLQTSPEERYRELVVAWARSLTAPAHLAPLDAIFVEPELLSPSSPPQTISETEAVPLGLRTLPPHRILGGHPRLAILGAPGTGRTTLLAHLALACARATDDMLEAAQEWLPLYVPLSVMDWDEDEDESKDEGEHEEENGGEQKSSGDDGIEKLLNAAVAAIGGGGKLADPLREHLEAGRSIVLADGWDELPSHQRQQAAAWLSELAGGLPGNVWLVAAGTRGYAPLTETGFVPLTLTPWDTRRVETFAEQWANAAESPVDLRELAAELQRAARAGYGVSPLELTLRAFVYLSDRSGQRAPAQRAALFDRTLDLLLEQEEQKEAPWLWAACRMALGQVALECQREGRTTASEEELTAAIEAALPPPEERPAQATSQVLRLLTGERGLLRPAGSKRYVFVHPLWRAYLTARQLVAVAHASPILIEHLDDPRWSQVWRFYAELGDMEPLAAALLRQPDDMFLTHLHTLSSWVSAAPEDAAWREKVMAVLARGFLKSDQLGPVRQTLAEALAATRMPGIAYLFKQALQHQNADVRSAAVLGLGRVASESDLPALEAALRDGDVAVRKASARALTYLGIDAATRLLEQVVQEADDTCRAIAAESLARRGEEGVAFLREMVESEDMLARRAAVMGLARLEARDLLEKVVRHEEEWIVHSAAAMALEELEEREKFPGVAPPLEIEQLPWLISWTADRGEGLGTGDAARRMLWHALYEGESSVRLAAAQALAHAGRPDDVRPLQAALNDLDPDIADAALEALAEISRRYDLRIG